MDAPDVEARAAASPARATTLDVALCTPCVACALADPTEADTSRTTEDTEGVAACAATDTEPTRVLTSATNDSAVSRPATTPASAARRA